MVRDISTTRVGRNNNQRNSETGSHFIDFWWVDVIVPSPPIVPCDEDCGGVPVLALADSIDDGRDPVGTFGTFRSRMVRVRPVRNDPGDLRQLAVRDVDQDPV